MHSATGHREHRAIAAHLAEAFDLLARQPGASYDAARGRCRASSHCSGVTGTVRMALRCSDMALWDALARSRECRSPLCWVASRGRCRAYDSRGLGLMEPDRPVERSGCAARKRIEGRQASAGVSVGQRGYLRLEGRSPCCRRRRRHHGGLQSGAYGGRGDRARTPTREGGDLLARGTDPP